MNLMLIQTIINGLLVSSVYLIVTLGLSLVLSIMRIVNFAHGEFVMIGAYITYWFYTLFKINPYISLFLCFIILFIIGLFVYKVGINKILDEPSLNQVLLTFGFSILFQNLALILWTANAYSLPLKSNPIKLGTIFLSRERLNIFIIGLIITLLINYILNHTNFGKTLLAISQNKKAALLVGINVTNYYLLSFGIASGLAGLAGGLVSFVMYASPFIGVKLGLRAFTIIVLAGLGNINMTIVASLILGLSEAMISIYLPQGSGWAEGLSFLLILSVLAIKPSGIKGLRTE